jgi:AhpD family alkylhydroperoxidase
MMTQRIHPDPTKMKDAWQAMLGLKAAVLKSTLEHSLIKLIKVRVSQINGCGYCIDMHTKEARAAGETEQRLYLLDAWREAVPSMYSSRERAALAWAEAVTRLERQNVEDAVFEQVQREFTEAELVALTLCVVEINSWNRFAISFRFAAGSYQPDSFAKTS